MGRTDAQAAARLADRVRQACLDAAVAGYEEGGLGGLCAEGRWELAVDRVRSLDLERLVRDWLHGAGE